MDYLHNQKPLADNINGVPVKLTTVKPDGTKTDIGTATSDISGLYSILWTPPDAGKYTIIANFEGSNSYWSSFAETAAAVSTSGSGSNTQGTGATSDQLQATNMYVLVVGLVLIVLVIVAIVLLVRKRQ
jgi:hypothetical protein